MARPEADEFDAVLRRHGNAVWRLIVRLLGTEGHDAADCFQQAFVELASHRERSNDIRDAGALLKRIATTIAIDLIRQRIRERARTESSNLTQIAARREDDPSARLQADEFLDELRAALGGLPETQSTAFVLTQIDGMSHDEAALTMHVTVSPGRTVAQGSLHTTRASHNV